MPGLVVCTCPEEGSERKILPLHRAVRQQNADIVKEILAAVARLPAVERGKALDAQTKFGFTSYMLACEHGAVELVQLLVAAGCDTSVTDDRQRTGLDIASDAGHGDRIFACLQELGADSSASASASSSASALQRLSSGVAKYASRPQIAIEHRYVPYHTVWDAP